MKTSRRIISFIIMILIAAMVVSFATNIVMPKRNSYGCLWDAYKAEPQDSIDVMFFGSSIAYCDIIPAQIFEEQGIRSYSMTGPVLNMPQLYYYVKESLKTQSPKIIFVELAGMFFDRYPNYDFLNISYMPVGFNRIAAMAASIPAEEWGDYLLPARVYHSRWKTMSIDEYKAALSVSEPDINAGYTYLTEAKPFAEVVAKEETEDTDVYTKSEKYLIKIKELCEKKDIRLVIYLSPRRNSYSQVNMDALAKTAGEYDLELIDFNDSAELIGLDCDEDYYDRSHLNFYGAQKFSSFLGDYLAELGIPGSESNDLWKNRIDHYHVLRKQAVKE